VQDAPASRPGSRAKRRRQALSQRERRFVQDASHALRSPLTVCRWHLELLDEAAGEGERLGVVLAELERMEHLLEDLGVLAEAAEPGFLRREPIDLELFAHELIAEAATIAERDWRLDRADGTVVGDPRRLREAVLRLADTAARHTDRSATIAIGACFAGGEARLWVRGNGGASSAEKQAEIWERSAADACAGRDLRGGGIDLAVVRAIIDAHDGRVEFKSTRDEGWSFTAALPVRGTEIGPESGD